MQLSYLVPAMMQWFPSTPATDDQMYLLLEHPCPLVFVQPPRLRYSRSPDGWTLELDARDSPDCAIVPPRRGAARVYALPMPEFVVVETDPVVTRYVDVVRVEHTIAEVSGARRVLAYTLEKPAYDPAPASLAGIWSSPLHSAQGLMLHVDKDGRVTMNWSTFDRERRPQWLVGTSAARPAAASLHKATIDAPAGLPGGFETRIPLSSVTGGTFAGGGAASVSSWGTAYVTQFRSDSISLAWWPKPETGLSSGSNRFNRTSRARETICNLQEYAAVRAADLEVVATRIGPH